MKILLGIQARSASKRFPRKIYQLLAGKPLLKWSYDACKEGAKNFPDAMVRVLGPKDDLELKTFCASNLMQGIYPDAMENDLWDRYIKAALETGAEAVVRVTADCHLTEPGLVAEVLKSLTAGVDYISNTINRTYPEGTDLQGASLRALKWMSGRQDGREHPFFDFDKNLKIRDQFEKSGMKYEELVNKQLAGLLVGGSIDREEDLIRWNKFIQEQGAPFLQ